MLEEDALARTFSPPSYADPTDLVADYRRVMEYASRHPEAGSTAVSSALDLPRSRVRPWLDGARPDAVHAIEGAEELGWLDASPASDTGRAFAVVSAAILSGGSISIDVFTPRVTTTSPQVVARVEWALDELGCGWREMHADDEKRATELEPADQTALLGRALVALGHPAGSKTTSDIRLPGFLDDLPQSIRTEWAIIYLHNRSVTYTEKDTLSVLEDRPRAYREALASFLSDVAGAPVSTGERGVIVSADAARKLSFGRDGPFRD